MSKSPANPVKLWFATTSVSIPDSFNIFGRVSFNSKRLEFIGQDGLFPMSGLNYHTSIHKIISITPSSTNED